MAASICAAVATLLAIIWYFIQKNDSRRKKYEEAKEDAKKAIAAHDTAGLLDAERRMSNYK